MAQKKPPALSFFNLVEAHILNAIRERFRLQEVRPVLRYVERELDVKRPLVEKVFQTDGVSLFVEHCGQLLNVSEKGQLAMQAMLSQHLERIEFDPGGRAARLYPFTRDWGGQPAQLEDPKAVVFDPLISFGRLVIASTGIATSAVADRFAAGDTIDELARDYGIDRGLVEEAIRCESLSGGIDQHVSPRSEPGAWRSYG